MEQILPIEQRAYLKWKQDEKTGEINNENLSVNMGVKNWIIIGLINSGSSGISVLTKV